MNAVAGTVVSSRMPAMLDFQRRANMWLRKLRDFAENAGITPTKCRTAGVDFFDVLRANMNIQNGIALANLHSAKISGSSREIAAATTASAAASFEESNSPSSPIASGIDKNKSSATDLRRMAYLWKRSITRRFLGVPTLQLPIEQPSVLSLPRMPAHLLDILPIASMLQSRYRFAVPFAAVDRRMAQEIHSHGMPPVGVYSHLKESAAAIGKRSRVLLRQLLRIVDIVSQFNDDKFDEQEIAVLKRNSKEVLRSQLPDAFVTAHSLYDLLDVIRPTIVVAGNSYTMEGRLFVLLAKAFQIPSAVIEHGSIFSDDPIWEDCPSDYVFAWGRPSQRALVSCGVPESRIIVTGGPRHDAVFERSRVREPSAADSARRCILVATSGPGDQVSHEQHHRFISALFQAAKSHPDIRWVVKLHKKDRRELYEVPESATCTNVEIVTGTYSRDGLEIFDYLHSACALVTVTSTAALDAMAVSVPVITFDVWEEGGASRSIEFLERGCTRVTRNAAELTAAARKAWDGVAAPASDSAAEDYIQEHFVNRGRAAQAVCDNILRITGTAAK